MNLKILIPSLISSLRIILAPLLFYYIINDLTFLAFTLFLIVVFSDYFDGYIARKLKLTSNKGAFMDIISDFVIIIVAFAAFIIKGIYPYWILLLIIVMFLQFIITSKTDKPVYDPIGKYYGSFLFICIGINLILQLNLINNILLILIVIFSSISLISRFKALYMKS